MVRFHSPPGRRSIWWIVLVKPLAVSFDPGGYFAELVQPCLAKSFPSLFIDRNESAFGQDLHVERPRLAGGIEFFRQGIYIQRSIGQQANDRSSRWIGYGLKYVPSLFHDMQVCDCKYMCKYLLAQIYFGRESLHLFLSKKNSMPMIRALERQRAIYLKGLSGKRPVIPFDAKGLRALAKRKMSAKAWAYIDGGAGNEETMATNTTAFSKFVIRPRIMRPNEAADFSGSLFGMNLSFPLLLAPIGVLDLVRPGADRMVAGACRETGVPF